MTIEELIYQLEVNASMNDGKVVANKDKLIQAIRELDRDTKKSMMDEITYLTNNPEWKDDEVISKRVNQLGRILWLGSQI